MSSSGADEIHVAGQQYVVLSYVGPNANQKCDNFAIKISGCFASEEDARRHVEKLQKDDPRFDRYVAKLYNFIPFPPPGPDEMDDVTYQNERLDKLMKGHAESQKEARRHFQKRKDALMHGYIDPSDENSDFYTKEEVAPISHPADHLERLKLEHPEATTQELAKMASDIVAKEMEDAAMPKPCLKIVEEDEAEAEASPAPALPPSPFL